MLSSEKSLTRAAGSGRLWEEPTQSRTSVQSCTLAASEPQEEGGASLLFKQRLNRNHA